MNKNLKRHNLLKMLVEQRANVELQKEGFNALGIPFENIYAKLKCSDIELNILTAELYKDEEIGYHDS